MIDSLKNHCSVNRLCASHTKPGETGYTRARGAVGGLQKKVWDGQEQLRRLLDAGPFASTHTEEVLQETSAKQKRRAEREKEDARRKAESRRWCKEQVEEGRAKSEAGKPAAGQGPDAAVAFMKLSLTSTQRISNMEDLQGLTGQQLVRQGAPGSLDRDVEGKRHNPEVGVRDVRSGSDGRCRPRKSVSNITNHL